MALRFRIRELTPHRIGRSIARRARDLPHRAAWAASSWGRANRERMEKFRNLHAGQRCFIIANGPSLARTNLDPLRDETTFGMNRIYIHFPKMGFPTTYLSVANPIVIEEFAADFRGLTIPKFIAWEARRHFEPDDASTLFFKTKLSLGGDPFVAEPTHPISVGGTVTYATLQLAYFMGFQEVVLVGLDHSFHDKGTPTKLEVRTAEQDLNHFNPNYFPKGVRWELPDLRRSELAYAHARRAFEKDGRRIVDATIDGKCQVFPKATLESLL